MKLTTYLKARVPQFTRREKISFLALGLLFAISFTIVAMFSSPVKAASVGVGGWYETPTVTYYYVPQTCGSDGECTYGPCTPFAVGPYSVQLFQGSVWWYSDSNCTTLSDKWSATKVPGKPAYCPDGYIMTGARLYIHYELVDDEHVDPLCSPLQDATLTGSITLVSASNANSRLEGGYKEAICPAGQVGVGVYMYGIYQEVDEEHVDIGCLTLSSGSVSTSGAIWVEAPNAWATLNGGYKEALCPSQGAVLGLRFYERAFQTDEEHVDVLCGTVASTPSNPSTPTVDVYFQ